MITKHIEQRTMSFGMEELSKRCYTYMRMHILFKKLVFFNPYILYASWFTGVSHVVGGIAVRGMSVITMPKCRDTEA